VGQDAVACPRSSDIQESGSPPIDLMMVGGALRALMVEDNDGDVGLMKGLLAEEDGTAVQLSHVPRLGEGLSLLERERFDVLLLDLSLPDSQGLETVVRAHTATPDLPILVLTGLDDEGLAVQAVERGAQDYLVKGQFDGGQLVRAMRYAIARREAQGARSGNSPSAQREKVLAVVGAKGGCGATTVACHTAMEISLRTNQRTLLADFDLVSGTVGFLMKVESPYSVLDAAENADRLDADLWKSLTCNAVQNVDVLTAPAMLSYKRLPKPERLGRVLRFARLHYGWTVIDLGRGVSDFSRNVLDEVDETLLVATSDVVALSRCKQILDGLAASGYPRQHLHLVVNQLPKRPPFTLPEIESVLEVPVYAALTDSREALDEAYGHGKLAPRTSPLGSQFSGLASKLAGIEEPAGKRRKFAIF